MATDAVKVDLDDDRVLQVVRLVAEGYRLQEIADAMCVSRTTAHRWYARGGGDVNRRPRREVKDPIAVGPFLKWCDKRRERMQREWDSYPAIGDCKAPGKGSGLRSPRLRCLMEELGWEPDTGARRLHRWRFQNPGGVVSRPVVEDALWRAGVSIYDVYPELLDADLVEDGCVAA
jgi:hypothetical protein